MRDWSPETVRSQPRGFEIGELHDFSFKFLDGLRRRCLIDDFFLELIELLGRQLVCKVPEVVRSPLDWKASNRPRERSRSSSRSALHFSVTPAKRLINCLRTGRQAALEGSQREANCTFATTILKTISAIHFFSDVGRHGFVECCLGALESL